MDETSSKKGHNTVSVFVDIERSKVLYAAEGKDASTVQRFKQDLSEHGGDPKAVEEMCCDMSPAFIGGIEKHFPNAELTFDKVLTKVINEAVDKVRREEQKEHPDLARSRYAWLKNPENLKASQAETIEALTVS